MTTSSRNLLVFLFVALAAVVAYVALQGAGNDPGPAVPEPPRGAKAESPPRDPGTPLEARPSETGAKTRPQPARPRRVAIERRTPSGADLPQGVKGRVVAPTGAPVAGAEVYLMEGMGTDIFRMLRMAQRGVIIPPVAATKTDANGAFALGVAEPDPEKTYEIRVVTDRYVEHKVPGVRILANQWWDAGRLQLARGATVHGRVTVAGTSGMPVPDAEVVVQQNTGFPSVTPTPGRERGLVAKVDRTGSYRIENVPAGVVNIYAVAPGYAKRELQNTTIDANADNEINFELSQGLSIAGVVVDAAGQPIPNAKVEALAISSKTPVTADTLSGPDGAFELIGLMQGPYMITVAAPGYVRKEEKPVEAGERALELILEKQSGARLRVFGKDGRLLRNYTLTLKTYFKEQEFYGNTDIPPQPARPDREGVTTVEGLDPGQYVFQVEAKGHAKAFSQPFTVAVGAEPPLVEVHMNEGGVIEGVVMSANGTPLPGVTVETLPNHLDDNPFTRMFGAIIPYKITRKSTTTDAQGRYRFALLNPGKYQLKFTHPEHYDVYQKGHEVRVGQVTRVPPLTMYPGTIVGGTVRVDGKPAGQVKVTFSQVTDPDKPAPGAFNAEAITDNQGRYVLPKRVPPGRYQVMAARQTLESPLLQIADFAKTKKEITILRGQKRFQLDIQISSQ